MAHDAFGAQQPQDRPATTADAAGLADDPADLALGYEAADPQLLAQLWGEAIVNPMPEVRP